MKTMRSYLIAVCIVAFFAARVSADTVDLIDIKMDYEITARGDGGFFASIHSISIDEDVQELYVLHDYPVLLSTYTLAEGKPVEMRPLGKEIVEPASVLGCSGRLFLLSRRKLWELTTKGELISVNTAPDGAQARADIVLCYSPNGLLLINQEEKKVDALAWNGVTLKVAGPVSDKSGKKTLVPFAKAADAALTVNGDIYIIDSSQQAVRIINPGKTNYRSFSFARQEGSNMKMSLEAIDTDSSGNAWAVNGDEKSLDVYGALGDLRYRALQTDENGFRFINPTDIIIDSRDKIYLLDSGTNTVRVFHSGLM